MMNHEDLERSWNDNSDHFQEHIASGSEALNEFANNAGMDNPDRPWLLHDRDVWVKNPYYNGPPVPHPEDDYPREEDYQEGLVKPRLVEEEPEPEPEPEPTPEEDLPF